MTTFLLKKTMGKLLSLSPPPGVVDDYNCNAILITLKPKVQNPFSEEVLCAPRILIIEAYFKNNQIYKWIVVKYNEIKQDVICKSNFVITPSIDEIMSFLFEETIEGIDVAHGESLNKIL